MYDVGSSDDKGEGRFDKAGRRVLEGQREREGRDEEIFYHSISSQDAAGLRNILFFPLLQIVS
jgi:hypothetical protein